MAGPVFALLASASALDLANPGPEVAANTLLLVLTPASMVLSAFLARAGQLQMRSTDVRQIAGQQLDTRTNGQNS